MVNDQPVGVPAATAAEIGERRNDLGFSTPIVIIELVWYTIFVTAIIVIVYSSQNEVPILPLRMWLVGYGALCTFHMLLVIKEHSNRRTAMRSSGLDSNLNSSSSVRVGCCYRGGAGNVMLLDGMNVWFSYIWWIFGLIFVSVAVSVGEHTIVHEAPKLFWSGVTFLAIDVFTVVICTAVLCISDMEVFCCLPCVIAILYVGRSGRIYEGEIESGKIQESCSQAAPFAISLSPKK